MGVVWKATDTTLDRDVAIKVLPEAFTGDPERMMRFEREARLLASLNHPHIASIYGVGSADGVRFLAMELVEGDDLAARIARGPIPIVDALEFLRQVAEALEAAHEKGIVHRDLKPANVKLTADSRVKVLDFGLAKALEDENARTGGSDLTHSPTTTSPMTAANVILGTAAYMSPEQARGKSVDRRADIWAFGCVLYECLTGRRAFAGETVSDTIAKILERDPDLGALPTATPARVRELIQRCLAKDARLRLRDIGDARILLDEVLATRSPSGILPVLDEAGANRPRRGVSVGAAALGLGVVAMATLLLGYGLGSRFRAGGGDEPRCTTLVMPTDLVVQSGAITPDGRRLVVIAHPRGVSDAEPPASQVYVRSLDRYAFEPLPGTEGAVWAGTLLDGRTIVFTAPTSPGGSQYRYSRVPIDGSGPPIAIADWKDSWQGGCELNSGDQLMMDGPASFIRLPRNGGAPSRPVKLEAGRSGVRDFTLWFALPGDRGVLTNVGSYDAQGWHYDIGVLDPGTGRVKIVVADGANAVYSPAGYLLFARGDAVLAVRFDPVRLKPRGPTVAVWSGLKSQFSVYPGRFTLTRDGSLFYVPGDAGSARRLAFLDASGRLDPWSAERWAIEEEPQVSPDGRRLSCTILNAHAIDEIWVSDLAHPGFRRLGTDPNADCVWPSWSPDGKSIAYARMGKDDRDGIYVQSVDGGEPRRIFKSGFEGVFYGPSDWLPDGSAMVLTRAEAGRGRFELLPLGPGEADSSRLRPLLQSRSSVSSARVSRNGRAVAFTSNETGRAEAFVAELHPDGSTGHPIQLSTQGGGTTRWSPDGTALYFEGKDRRMMRASVRTAPELSVSAPTPLFDLDKLRVVYAAALPDGRFLATLKGEGEGEVTRYNLVLGWAGELQRRMRTAR